MMKKITLITLILLISIYSFANGEIIDDIVVKNNNRISKQTIITYGKIELNKEHIFRSDNNSSYYLKILDKLNLQKVKSFGTYPLPMISHSIDFPFSLMPEKSEKTLVEKFKNDLEYRKKTTGQNPWICEEGYGNAFLIWALK